MRNIKTKEFYTDQNSDFIFLNFPGISHKNIRCSGSSVVKALGYYPEGDEKVHIPALPSCCCLWVLQQDPELYPFSLHCDFELKCQVNEVN